MATRLKKNWPNESDKAIRAGIRRGLYYASKVALRAVQNTSIGRAILGNYGISGLDKKVKGVGQLSSKQVRVFINRVAVKRRGTKYHAGLRAQGFTALIETGGKTYKHTIRARGKKVLANVGAKQVFGKSVNHPGGPVRREPFLGRSVTSSQPRIVAEIEKGFAKIGERLQGPVRG